jgi:hypothetical protein
VQKSSVDIAEARKAEVAEASQQSNRIDQLAAKIAAVSGQAELMQYGALAKPLLDGMATLSAHLMAADGTAVTLDRAAEMRARKEEERLSRLQAARDAMRKKRAEAPDTGLGGGGPDGGGGGGGGGGGPGGPGGARPPRHTQGAGSSTTGRLLTETYVPSGPSADATVLSLAQTRAAGGPRTAGSAARPPQQLHDAEADETARHLALDQTVTKMRKTQSRVRAQLAVHEASTALERAVNGGDLWSDGPASPYADLRRANAGAATSAAWSMLDELEAERAKLEAEISRPLPFRSPGAGGKGAGKRG